MLEAHHFLVFAVAVSAIAAWYDWRTGEIPDRVTLVPLGVAPLAHFASPLLDGKPLLTAAETMGFSIFGAILCGVVPLLVWKMSQGHGMGGGDIKLLAALGAILRPLVGIEAEFCAILASLLIALAGLAYEGRLLRSISNTVALGLNPLLPSHRRRQISPDMLTRTRFGPAIFVGTFCAAFTHWRAS